MNKRLLPSDMRINCRCSHRLVASDDLRTLLAEHYRHWHARRLRESASYRDMYLPADVTFQQMMTAMRAMA